MTDPITLIIPVASRFVLTSNQRLHWAVKSKKTKHLRESAALWKRSHLGDLRMDRAVCWVEIGFPTRARRDPGNWYPSVKALIDGITNGPTKDGWAYGLLPDDDSDHLKGPYIDESQTPSRQGIVRFDFRFEEWK